MLSAKPDMNKYISHRAVLSFICFGMLAALLTACKPFDSQYEAALDWKRGVFQRLQGNLSGPIASRIQKMPIDLLKTTQDYDRSIGIPNSDRYAARDATADELALIKSYIDLLPRAHQKVFASKLLAVYFIDGFSGAGMTEWVVDREGHTYYYLILNSSLFNISIDDWLTYKEDSQFESRLDKSTTSPSIRVRTQTNFKALMYGLLHEGSHIVDYELGVTPYIDPQHRRFIGRNKDRSDFTDGVWVQGSKPVERYDFKHRGDINTYGIFPKRGLIPRSELPEMFSQLAKSPFVSFYSATSWNEDLADYMTYHHIERYLGGSVTVELLSAGNVVERYAPVKTSLAKQREKSVRVFYE